MNTEIAKLIFEISEGANSLILQDAVIIKLSPHHWPLHIYGVCINDKRRIALFDGDNWHELKKKDDRYNIVAGSIYQRLKSLQSQLKTA
jgi:hypothetical protein